jgi:hypothetical protein
VGAKMTNSNRVLVGKPVGRRLLGRPRYRQKDIKMGIVWEGMD